MTPQLPSLLRWSSRVLSCRHYYSSSAFRSLASDNNNDLRSILNQLSEGKLTPAESEELIRRGADQFVDGASASPETILQSFANIDHTRSSRTGFPEAVFGAGKTPEQIAMILDDMARHFNERVVVSKDDDDDDGAVDSSQRAILATRVSPELYEQVKAIPLSHGSLKYHSPANIISMIPSQMSETESQYSPGKRRIVVATAGTTDLPVAEEAAVVLEAAQCEVDRIYDVGVAGLHRVIRALPRLQDPEVGCVIVCAGMDGALPSVVGGLVSCPVIAVPTSIGYGVSLGGISAMLTMLNTCSPGVGVVNIDNGFGAAALAYKCIRK